MSELEHAREIVRLERELFELKQDLEIANARLIKYLTLYNNALKHHAQKHDGCTFTPRMEPV